MADKRNEYRVRPSNVSEAWYAEYRTRGWFGWSDWKRIDWMHDKESAIALCRDHSGARDEYLGRLP